ncbi:MAG TPA: DUF4870 domain-containing protein [Verrucomicrobiae bacterium]|nr:DUF4870 domain-containing protein [Verrucomicrobiae bacterium]
MSTTPAPNPLVPTQDEKTMALFAHLLQLIVGWIGPLVMFLIKRESRFVSFHALQALLLQVALVIGIMVFAMFGMLLTFLTVASTAVHQPPGHVDPPVGIFLMILLIWIVAIGSWILVLVSAIVYGIKASHGEWAEYPVLGRWARKILKIGPGGTAFTGS